ncbi:CD151 antigen isoform X2 [Alosa alosa]|uniref:CD151 antigen isoform X2 n=1 Tax=Alosa alosa TaxID=278164 RepID=UPI0020152C4D|nr:CD151 antigen isoform X2 [Alosa alosa]
MEVFVFIMTQCTKCMGAEEKTNTCGTICLKYLLFTFNFIFWLAGGAVAAVGVWTLVDKSEYISLLASSAYSASAYVLILAGVVVVATGILGCCATIKEHKGFLIVYFILLLFIFLLEITAGVLAYVYYQELSDELRVNLKETMVNKYDQPGQEHVTKAVDKLHQDLKCCGSINYTDWRDGAWIKDRAGDRVVPDSCCKTPSDRCGRRHHPSNIYNVEGGCIGKLEEFLLQHLQILGGVGIGLAFIQLVGMIFTCCLYQSLKEDPY